MKVGGSIAKITEISRKTATNTRSQIICFFSERSLTTVPLMKSSVKVLALVSTNAVSYTHLVDAGTSELALGWQD